MHKPTFNRCWVVVDYYHAFSLRLLQFLITFAASDRSSTSDDCPWPSGGGPRHPKAGWYLVWFWSPFHRPSSVQQLIQDTRCSVKHAGIKGSETTRSQNEKVRQNQDAKRENQKAEEAGWCWLEAMLRNLVALYRGAAGQYSDTKLLFEQEIILTLIFWSCLIVLTTPRNWTPVFRTFRTRTPVILHVKLQQPRSPIWYWNALQTCICCALAHRQRVRCRRLPCHPAQSHYQPSPLRVSMLQPLQSPLFPKKQLPMAVLT